MLVSLMRKKRINKVIITALDQKDKWIRDENSKEVLKLEKNGDFWIIKNNEYVSILERYEH